MHDTKNQNGVARLRSLSLSLSPWMRSTVSACSWRKCWWKNGNFRFFRDIFQFIGKILENLYFREKKIKWICPPKVSAKGTLEENGRHFFSQKKKSELLFFSLLFLAFHFFSWSAIFCCFNQSPYSIAQSPIHPAASNNYRAFISHLLQK